MIHRLMVNYINMNIFQPFRRLSSGFNQLKVQFSEKKSMEKERNHHHADEKSGEVSWFTKHF